MTALKEEINSNVRISIGLKHTKQYLLKDQADLQTKAYEHCNLMVDDLIKSLLKYECVTITPNTKICSMCLLSMEGHTAMKRNVSIVESMGKVVPDYVHYNCLILRDIGILGDNVEHTPTELDLIIRDMKEVKEE